MLSTNASVRPARARPGREDVLQLGRFAAVGASGYLVNLAVFTALVAVGARPAAAAVGSFCVAVANNYLWNRRWTFGATGPFAGQGARFAAVAVGGLLVNLAILNLLLRAGVAAVPAQAAAVVVVTPLNYLGNRLWTFGAGPLVRDAERARAWRRVLGWWALSRTVVLGAALAVQLAGWPRASWYPPFLVKPFALLDAWDGRWYRMVADRGYLALPGHQSDTAFFPLYPASIDVLHGAGLPVRVAALLLANAGFALGLVALYELVRTWLPAAAAERAAIYAAIFPVGYVFSMQYPEGMVLAALAGAGVAAVRGRWTTAAALGAAATLGRPEAVFLALPLGVLALRRRDPGAAAAAVAPPLALGCVCLYQLHTVGNALAFSDAQRAWGRRFSVDGARRAVLELLHAQGENLWLVRDAAFCVVYVVLLALALRAGVPLAWVIAGALVVLLPLESGSFTSDARFGLLAPAVFGGLASAGRFRAVDLLLRPAMLCLLAAGTATILLRWP